MVINDVVDLFKIKAGNILHVRFVKQRRQEFGRRSQSVPGLIDKARTGVDDRGYKNTDDTQCFTGQATGDQLSYWIDKSQYPPIILFAVDPNSEGASIVDLFP